MVSNVVTGSGLRDTRTTARAARGAARARAATSRGRSPTGPIQARHRMGHLVSRGAEAGADGLELLAVDSLVQAEQAVPLVRVERAEPRVREARPLAARHRRL